MSKIELRLGDVINLTDPTNELLNEQTFLIDYIDSEKVELVHTNTFKKIKLKVGENGAIGSVTRIVILSRSPDEGYAKQHKLVTGTWVDILLQNEVSLILTCEITNTEGDMIELKTTDGDILFINFDYKGIPDNLPIVWIKRRENRILRRSKSLHRFQLLKVLKIFHQNLAL